MVPKTQPFGDALNLEAFSFPQLGRPQQPLTSASAAPTEAPTEAPVAPPAPARPSRERPPAEAPVDPGFRPDPGDKPAPHCPDSTCPPP